MNKPKVKIRAGLDTGASLSKGVVEIHVGDRHEIKFIRRNPACKPIIDGFISQALRAVTDKTTLVSFGDQNWLVGVGAANYAQSSLYGAKAPTTIAKVLAIVGDVARQYPGSDIALTLGVMIPLSEFGDAPMIAAELTKHLWKFSVNNKPVRVAIGAPILVVPECYGVGINLPKGKPTLTIGCGHRDVTSALVKDGEIEEKSSRTLEGFGMTKLLSYVPQSFKDEFDASQCLFNYFVTQNVSYLERLGGQGASLKDSVDRARKQTMNEIQSEFGMLASKVTRLVLVGGNSLLFPDMASVWPHVQVLTGRTMVSEMKKQFPKLAKTAYIRRGLDAYGLWRSLPEVV